MTWGELTHRIKSIWASGHRLMSRSGNTAVDFLPFAKLTQMQLAPRVRSLLEGCYQTTWPTAEAALERALDELDRDLFKGAERAPNVNEQNRSFEGLREFRRHRSEFLLAFRDALQRSVLALVDRSVIDESLHVVKAKSGKGPELSLVDPSELEEELALSEIAAKAELRASSGLQFLGYRFGVIAASAPIELETLPLGPHKLCAALRAAARRFDVILAHRVLLYRAVDKTLFGDPAAMYEALNRYLIEHRVFPRLQLARKSVAAPVVSDAPAAKPQEADPVAKAEAADTGAATTAAAPAPRADSPPELPAAAHATAPAVQDSPAAHAFQQLIDANAHEQQRNAAPSVRSSGESALDAQFFSTLRELLAGRRHGSAAAETAVDASRPVAEHQDLQAVLTVLQSQPAAPVMVGGKWVNRGIGHIKQDMLNQLRSLSDGAPPRLREEDADTIDLVGFLFDHLLSDYRPNSTSHSLMSRLQVPLLKVALKDKSFFTRRNHPARQLLNSIAETSAYWVEDEEQDRPVVEKMQMVVDRVIREFDDDVGVFDRLFDDLNKHMGGMQKKAEVAERRHVEAAKGREKLELARAAAQEAVQQRIFEREPPAAVKTLLESAWTDAIALSLLRQGIESPKTRERLALVDQLVDAFIPGRAPAAQKRTLEDLRGPLEEGLAAVGFHEGAINKAWEDISRLVDADQEQAHQVASSSIEEIIKQKPRLGEEAKPAHVTASDTTSASAASGTILQGLRKAERIPVGPREQAMIDRIKQMPFGTWFEFTVNQQGEKARRKLCWFSPVTGRCLFVNARGAKGEERMIEQLARDMLRGNAHVVEQESENLIDRAWKGIMSMFKGVGIGRGGASDIAIVEG